jgi:hypothetical protein
VAAGADRFGGRGRVLRDDALEQGAGAAALRLAELARGGIEGADVGVEVVHWASFSSNLDGMGR